jgi:hypothetical protein
MSLPLIDTVYPELSSVVDTSESKLGGVIVSAKSKHGDSAAKLNRLNGVVDITESGKLEFPSKLSSVIVTTKSKLGVIINTSESEKRPLSELLPFKGSHFFQGTTKPNPKKG